MDFTKYPLLNTPNLNLVVLKTAMLSNATVNDALARLQAALRVVDERPPFDDETLRSHLRMIATALAEASLLRLLPGDRIRITVHGQRTIAAHPAGFDTADLVDDVEFRRQRVATRRHSPESDPRNVQYEEGYDAYRAGTPITENPFRQDSVDHLAWEDGWCEARDDDTHD